MAETMTSTNGIPDSTTMSTLESTTHIPIAQLSPLLPASASKSVKAVVTLTWPYSSRTGSVAFLLAEPDFRLRRIRGQVRVQFSGSSANAVAKFGITSGDEVILCLDGVEYVEAEPPNVTPGRGVEFELKFTERLMLQFRPEESQDVKTINIDHPNPEPIVASTPALTTETEAETEGQIPEVPSTPVPFSNRVATNNAEEYFSPVFLKRERISYGSMFEEGYDPFEEGDGSVRGRGRKRTRLSTTWRFASRSPSPSPEVEEPVAAPSENDIQEPASQHAPAMTDEGVQTMEVETMEVETGVAAEVTPTLEQSQATIVDKAEANGVVQAVDAEAPVQEEPQVEEAITTTMPPPKKQSDLAIPEVEQQQTPLDNIDEKTPSSPQLRPLPSEGLPLVSPLVTGRFEMFNNHIHNDHNVDLDNPNAPAVYSAEADSPIQDNQVDAKEDLYSARPGSHTSNQPNSDQTTYQTSAILSGDEHGSPNMETTFTPHNHGEFEAGEGAEQFFPHHNTSGSDPYTSVHVYAEIPGDQGRYIHGGLEEDMAQYNYPDPEEIHPQSNNWGTQSSTAYPDLEDSHQPASHSPYPQHPSMSSMVRSQSNQSRQSLQSHRSPKSQPVDLTESSDEDEDAEGYPEVEDNSQQHMPSSHLPVEHGEERSDDDDDDGDDGDDDEGEEDEDNMYDDENIVDEYGEGYSDEYDENMELRGRGDYLEGNENGTENDYDEDNYSEDEMNNEAPLQQHPPREPEVIDLLSSDDEDEAGSPVAQIGGDIEDDEEIESGQETEEYEDEEEDEDDENLDVVGEGIKNNDIPTTNSQELLRESPDGSVEDESMENESMLVNERNDSIKTGTEMPKIISNASESGFDAQIYVDPSLDEPRGAQQSPPSQGSSEEKATIDLDSPEPMDVKTSLDNPSAATATDNLDGLFRKLEEVESETQLDQEPSNARRVVPQNGAVDLEYDVEDFGNEANTDETSLQETEPSEPTEDPPTIIEISQGPIQRDNSENIINAAVEKSLPSPIAVEVSNASTIPSSTEESIKDRAAKSGWANSPKKDTLFSRTFGIDGANDTSEDGDEDNNDQISYPTLPVTEPEDQQELIDEAEQISQSQDPTHGIDITTNHGNDQLPTPDDTQMMNLDEDAFTSMSDLVQSQLQEEMGEMDEDSEMIHTDERIAKDQSTDFVDDEDQSSAQEAIDEDQDVAPETDSMDRDDDEAIEPELEDFEVEFTNAEVTEIEKTETIETEVEQADKNPVEDDIAEDGEEGVDEEVVEEVVEEVEEVDEEAREEEAPAAGESGELGNEKSDIGQIEADIRKVEMTELETQQTLVKMAGNSILGQDMDMAEIAEESIEQTVEETEAVVDKTEAILLEQIKEASPNFSGSLRNRNRKGKSPGIESTEKESTPVSPRQTQSSKDLSPSPNFKRSRKGSATLSPKQTRSKKLEPVVEAFTLSTPTKSNKENDMPSTRGSNRSRRSPSIIIDEEETPEGHDASAEMALESLGLPASPTKAGHHLRARACIDPKLRLTKYLCTDLSEYTTLKMLRFKMTSKLDILAIATSVPPEPRRAKLGPRHYTSTFTITDQTIAPGVVEVRIFRPYKDALPTPEVGDGVLLRDFSVLSVEGKGFALKSEEASSWAVFKDEGTEIEVRGPPVEFGHGEKKHMKELREWFHALDDDQKMKLDKVSNAMEKDSSAKSTPEKGKT